MRNGVRKRNAHVRAQDLKSERANARVNAQMRKWGAGVNAQVREQSARITDHRRSAHFYFSVFKVIQWPYFQTCQWIRLY